MQILQNLNAVMEAVNMHTEEDKNSLQILMVALEELKRSPPADDTESLNTLNNR